MRARNCEQVRPGFYPTQRSRFVDTPACPCATSLGAYQPAWERAHCSGRQNLSQMEQRWACAARADLGHSQRFFPPRNNDGSRPSLTGTKHLSWEDTSI